MSKNSSQNGISIGSEEWIEFNSIVEKSIEGIEIDHIMEPVDHIWSSLETKCYSGCCGIKAFELWEEDLRRVSYEIPEAYVLYKNLKEEIEKIDGEMLESTTLNECISKKTLLALLDHMISGFSKACYNP